MKHYTKTVVFVIFTLLSTVRPNDLLTVRVINLNVGSQTFGQNNFKELLDGSTNTLAQEEANPDLLIVALQDIALLRMPGVPVTQSGQRKLSPEQAQAFIKGYTLTRSFGMGKSMTYIFNKTENVARQLCSFPDTFERKYNFTSIRSVLSRDGTSAATISCNGFVFQLISIHQSQHTDDFPSQLDLYTRINKGLLMGNYSHMQVVTGNFHSRIDIKNRENFVHQKLEEIRGLVSQSSNSKQTAGGLNAKSPDGIIKAAPMSSINLNVTQLSDVTFVNAGKQVFIDYFFKYDQLFLSIKRRFMYGTFVHTKMAGAPSDKLNDGKVKQIEKIAGYAARYNRQTPKKKEGEEQKEEDTIEGVLKNRGKYLEHPTMSWSTRIIYNPLVDVLECVEDSELHTFIVEGVPSGHAATTMQFKVHTKMFKRKESKLPKTKLKIMEKEPGVILDSEDNHKVLGAMRMENIRDDSLNNNRKVIELVKAHMVSKKTNKSKETTEELEFNNEDEKKDAADKEEDKEETVLKVWETKEFDVDSFKDNETGIVRFIFEVKIERVVRKIEAKIWLGKLENNEDDAKDVVAKGKGVSEDGQWIFDVELIQA
eukprot:GAHX01001038.1.p1 GENE.GAHX01001038.1~~GAHX01001038.1.p1  ORF type:complete len:595 (+),score=115.08 GAHX01001038.1:54-1838(+)